MSLNVNLLDEVVYVITNEDEIVYVTTLPNDIGQQAIQFQDEGVNVGNPGAVSIIDFVGANVSIAMVGGKLTVTISGSSGGGGVWGSITGTITNQADLIALLGNYLTTAAAALGYQPLDSDLTAIAGLTSAANKIIRFTGSGTAGLLDFSTDGTLAGNSDTTLSSQKALKTYIDNAVIGLLELKGSTDCSANPNYPAASKGDSYYVTVAGKIGGASGKSVDIGDVYVALVDNAGGTEASVGTSWFVLEHNLFGALLSANNLSDLASAATARTNLGATTVGGNLFTLTNPSAVTYPKLNADNTVTAQTITQRRNDIATVAEVSVYSNTTTQTSTNQPNTEEDLGSIALRRFFDATDFTYMAISIRVVTASASANSPRVYPQYSTDGGTNWTTIGSGTGTEIISLFTGSTGYLKTSWITLPAGAKGFYLFRIAINGGDGAADPAWTSPQLFFKI